MKRWSRYLAGLAAGVATAIASGAAEPPRNYREATSVIAVEVPVQVLQDGKPVRGLTKDDFEVLEGRKVQAIGDLEVVDLTINAAGVPASEAPVPPPGRRHFLLLFDLANSEPSAILRARDAAHNVVDNDLHPSDLVGVATYSTTKGPEMVLGFTSDRRQVNVAIATLGVPQLYDRNPDPLGIQLAELEADQSAPRPAGTGLGKIGGDKADALKDFLEQDAAAERTSNQRNEANKLSALTESFAGFAHALNSVVGRKYVVFFSQGFDSSIITGSASAADQRAAASSVESGETWNVDSTARFGDTQSQNRLERMIESMRRSDCTIQSVDISGLVAQNDQHPRASGRDTLFTMARDTGGKLFENFNNLGDAMKDVIATTSVTYILTVYPQDVKEDGKYHPIKVRLKKDLRGTEIVARPGYYAPRPFGEKKAFERQLDTAELLLSGEPGGAVKIGAAVSAFRTNTAKAYVPVVVDIDGPDLIATKGGNAVGAIVYAYALNGKGEIEDYVAQPLQLDLSKVGDKLQSQGLCYAGDLMLPAGEYRLRILVRAGDKGAYGLREIALHVPAFDKPTLSVSPPIFPEATAKSLLARGKPKVEIDFPFKWKDKPFLPAGNPALAVKGEGQAIVVATAVTSEPIRVTGELIDSSGKSVADSSVSLTDREQSGAAGTDRLALSVKAGSAAPGDYVLKVRIEQKGQSAESRAALRIGI